MGALTAVSLFSFLPPGFRFREIDPQKVDHGKELLLDWVIYHIIVAGAVADHFPDQIDPWPPAERRLQRSRSKGTAEGSPILVNASTSKLGKKVAAPHRGM